MVWAGGCAPKTSKTAAPSPPVAAEAAPREPASPSMTREIEGMTPARAKRTVRRVGVEVEDAGAVLQFTAGQVAMALVLDERANRMRIVAPIADAREYGADELRVLMEANYHSALDARYALSEGVVYAAFIHPLSELSELELEAAIVQVANLVITFGTAFSSTGQVFGAPAPSPPSSRRVPATAESIAATRFVGG